MAKSEPRPRSTKTIFEFKLPLDGKPDSELDLSAYAFGRDGNLLASAPVQKGVARLGLTHSQVAEASISFGPTVEGNRPGTTTAGALERLQAYSPAVSLDPKVQRYEVAAVPEWLWRRWLWCSCRVLGKVVKPVSMDGTTTDMPVCHARVHICDVDPIWWLIPRLPDDIILRIRDELLVAIERPFPWPPPPPPGPEFRFDPGVIDPTPEKVAVMNRGPVASRLKERFAGSKAAQMEAARFSLPAEGSEMKTEAFMSRPQLDFASKAQLTSASTQVVRQGLLSNLEMIRPFFCWWPWLWPYFYTCDEMAVVDTDDQGNFDATIWYLCFEDTPDLYFWVEFCIGGTWTVVYDPGIACATYWDFACGSDVTIRITDPRVPWCSPLPTLPGMQVAVLSIGNDESLHQIQGQAAGSAEGLTNDGRPFGGSLEPHVWFSNDNLIAAGITHYRWSYRALGSSGSWNVMDRQVIRHYAEIDGMGNLSFKPFLLGPDPAPAIAPLNLFKIQSTAAPAGSFGWAPQVDARENTASAFFLSYLLAGGNALSAAGRYELKLELFDSAGSVINWTDAGVTPKVPTVDAPFGTGTVTTTAPAPEHIILDGSGKMVAFRLVLHVDNNPCQAVIHPVSIASSVMDPCGFISYHPASLVHVSFLARHPNDFATFGFETDKGSTGGVAAGSASGSVVGPTINGFTRDGASEWAKDIPVANLLGSCTKAAFAETLNVWALATDGWSILTYLDASGTPLAYALEPGP